HTRSKRDWSSDVCSSDLNSSPAPGDHHQRSNRQLPPGCGPNGSFLVWPRVDRGAVTDHLEQSRFLERQRGVDIQSPESRQDHAVDRKSTRLNSSHVSISY